MAIVYCALRVECQHLLIDLRETVAVILGNQTANVWNTYGALSRLTNVLSIILRHRLNVEQGVHDSWNFILGLRVLVPTVAPWLEKHRMATEGCSSKRSYLWIEQRLAEHTLSSYLKVLLDDYGHVKACYQDGAFLRHEDYVEALFICLKAVETNNVALLAELDPSLLVEPDMPATVGQPMRHRRSPSLPANMWKEATSSVQLAVDINRPPEFDVDFSSSSGGGHCVCPLRRRSPVDPDSATYFRARCCGQHPGKRFERRSKDFGTDRITLPKSTTWDCGLTSPDPAVLIPKSTMAKTEVSVSRPCSSRRFIRPRSRSDACLLLRSGVDSKQGLVRRTSLPSLAVIASTKSDVDIRPKWASLRIGSVLPVDYTTDRSMESSTEDERGRSAACRDMETEENVRPPEPASASPGPSSKPAALRRSPSHHARSKSDVTSKLTLDLAPISSESARRDTGQGWGCNIPMSSSLPCSLQEASGLKTPEAEEYPATRIFRRPVEGQSLTSFLSSQDFRTCAELDKENAHFSISEALISAIEQIKCNQMLKIAEEEDEESDDEEIKHLKQRIRIRRRERLQEKVVYRSPHLLSDGRTDTTTTSQSPSPRSSSSENKSEGNTSDSVDPIDLSDCSEAESKLSTLHESGLSLSMASLYSAADIQKPSPSTAAVQTSTLPQSSAQELSERSISVSIAESASSYLSAESVALSLLKKFSERQLPKASDLEWLVSEQDAPQKLLPLPTSWPVSPDDADNVHKTRLRGNLEWAPPRQQIIFNVHPNPQRKVIMAKQNYRCTGCGTKVEQGFMKRFRYCEYLGKYFCQCCHNNSMAHIPGRILRKWDFNKYYVSNFSRDLLAKMAKDPLYDINHINPSLYRRVKALNQVLQHRLQLYYIKDFIRACRMCTSLADELEQQPNHLVANPHLYSINELVQVQNGEMLKRLRPFVTEALTHVAQCQLCQARGFFCEFCKNDKEIIFPFQLGKVVQCPECWTCYHTECFVPEKCPKCTRIEARKHRLLQDDDSPE